MFHFPDFATVAPMPDETIETFSQYVEPELVEFWKQYGLGSFMNDYLHVINPFEYFHYLGVENLTNITGDGIAFPIMATALADLITWDTHRFNVLVFRDQKLQNLSGSIVEVLGRLERYGEAELDYRPAEYPGWGYRREVYQEARKFGMMPAYGMSYHFDTLLSQGGAATADNVIITDTHLAIHQMIEAQGVTLSQDLPASPENEDLSRGAEIRARLKGDAQ